MCRFFFFSSRRRHTRYWRDWSSDVCSSDLELDQAIIAYIKKEYSLMIGERTAENIKMEIGSAYPTNEEEVEKEEVLEDSKEEIAVEEDKKDDKEEKRKSKVSVVNGEKIMEIRGRDLISG